MSNKESFTKSQESFVIDKNKSWLNEPKSQEELVNAISLKVGNETDEFDAEKSLMSEMIEAEKWAARKNQIQLACENDTKSYIYDNKHFQTVNEAQEAAANFNKRVVIDNEAYSWTDFMKNAVDTFKMQVFENSDPYEIESKWEKQKLYFDILIPWLSKENRLYVLYSKKDYILVFDGYNDKVKVLKIDGTLISQTRFSDKEENYFFKWADRMIELYELRFDTWDITSTSSHRYSAIKGNFHIQIVRLGAMLFYKKHAIMLIYQKPFETNNCYSYYCNQADKAIQEILNSQTGKFDHVIGLT